MKTLLQMVRELSRADVSEFAVVSDRLPCVKVGGSYQPIDDAPRSTDEILEMLAAAGGSRYLDDLHEKPAQWTTRVDGVGSVAIAAVIRAGRAQARFTLAQRASVPAIPEEPPVRTALDYAGAKPRAEPEPPGFRDAPLPL